MNRLVKRVFYLILTLCLMFGLTQTALAAEEFRTTGKVNLRTGPSTGKGVIKTVDTGTDVDVLEHDPAGWSKVSVNGTVGYIRSDFLMLRVGDTPVTLKTTDGVNFRAGPSTDAKVLKKLSTGTVVEVLEHDPAGWSKVCIDEVTGYIRSDFLAILTMDVQQPSETPLSEQPQTVKVFRTTAGVNFRTGPSTGASIIKAIKAGSIVEMLEHDPDGWSKVSVNGMVGFIKSEYLSAGGGRVELLEWSVAKNVVQKGVPIQVVDVRTGLTYNIKCFSKGGHADVEPLTKQDTDTILKSRNGVWAWDPRPVWVTIGNRVIAASLNGMPHDVSTISNNGMNGHLCLHFLGTVTNSKSYQRDLNNAVMEAWKAGQ